MRLVPRFARVADAQFADGEEYVLEVHEQRSSKEHNHMFAAIKNAFDHIDDPETLAVLSTPNKLRQWSLIVSGWCDVTLFGPLSKRAAIKSAQTAAVNFRNKDDYVEISVRQAHDEDTGEINGWAVVIKTAKSQSRASMDKEDFRKSKTDVLEVLSGHIEVKRRDLERSAKDTA
ncbi:MAG: hypothetical protein Q7S17_05780 [Xanthobacteraceae bacterium]|nr:hypothetical protein [Xanthobacteraceae bacterium]